MIKSKTANNKPTKRTTKPRKPAPKRKKNPMTPNIGNLRKWAFLNFPKLASKKHKDYYDQKRQKDDLTSEFLHYFNLPIEKWTTVEIMLKPYHEAWVYINKQDISDKEKIRSWRELMLDKPELFEMWYL